MGLKLNRNAWHRKLQKYVLGLGTSRYDDMPNLCPYFWLTIFCLFAVIPKWIGVKIINSFNFLVSPIDRLVERFDSWYYNTLDMNLVMYWYEHSYERFSKWRQYNPISREELDKLERLYYDRKRSKLQQIEEAAAKKRKLMNKIAQYTSKVAPVFVLGLLGLGSWIVYMLATLAIANLANLLTIAIFLIGVILAAVIVVSIGFLIKHLGKKYLPPAMFKKVTIFGEIAEFIGMYIKSTKDNYCPSVDWE